MPWFKVDDGFYDHAKVIALLERREGLAAAGLWTLCGSWSSRHLTDGFISRSVAKRLGGTPKQARALVDTGLWIEVEGGYRFHKWLGFQPSKESVEGERAKARERMQRKRSGEHPPEPPSPVQQPRPDPTRPDPTAAAVEAPADAAQVSGLDACREFGDALARPYPYAANRPEFDSIAIQANADDDPPTALTQATRWFAREGGWAQTRGKSVVRPKHLAQHFHRELAEARGDRPPTNGPATAPTPEQFDSEATLG